MKANMNMKKLFKRLILAAASSASMCAVFAQILPPEHALLPEGATSADTLKLSMSDPACTRPNKAEPYRVTMVSNNITIQLGEKINTSSHPCASKAREKFDLGKLPAGDYTITAFGFDIVTSAKKTYFENVPFSIADARAVKQKPWVAFDYTGQWWDLRNSGSGLFIWQDARDPNDALLTAWFTYSADGKAKWYVFQPKFNTAYSTLTADLLETSRPPSATVPPPNPTSNAVAGSATLNFNDLLRPGIGLYTFTVTLKGQAPKVINIQRFKP